MQKQRIVLFLVLFFLCFQALAIPPRAKGKKEVGSPPPAAGSALGAVAVGVVSLDDDGKVRVRSIEAATQQSPTFFEVNPSLSLYKTKKSFFLPARPGKTTEVMAQNPPPGGIIGGPAARVKFDSLCQVDDGGKFEWRQSPNGAGVDVRFGGGSWFPIALEPEVLRSTVEFSASDHHTLVDLTPIVSPFRSSPMCQLLGHRLNILPVALHPALLGTKASRTLPFADLVLPKTFLKILKASIGLCSLIRERRFEGRDRFDLALAEFVKKCNTFDNEMLEVSKLLKQDRSLSSPATWNFNMLGVSLDIRCQSNAQRGLFLDMTPNLTFYNKKSGSAYEQWPMWKTSTWREHFANALNQREQRWNQSMANYLKWQAFWRWVREKHPQKHKHLLQWAQKLPRGKHLSPSFMIDPNRRPAPTKLELQAFFKVCVDSSKMKAVPR